jgi:cell division protein FtsW
MWRTTTVLLAIVLILSTIGIIMLTSTSGVHGEREFGDALFFVKRQAFSLVLALVLGFVCARIPYTLWQTFALPLVGISIVLLVLALTPGIGVEVKGSKRWINLGFFNFQPSELGKLAAIVLMAWYVSRSQRSIREFWRGLIFPLMALGLIAGLVLISPDFGTTFLIGSVGILMLFIGGTPVSYLLVTAVLGSVTFLILIMHNPVRMRRITAFLNPEKYAQNEAFQLLSALYAFVIGGAGGVGLGRSLQKRFYLPESHTDFIFAIIGEELGIAASLAIVLLFGGLFICGMRIAMQTHDLFARMLAIGITLMISLQASFNMAVVTGLVPTKGLPLPFISYGGSSILVTMMMVGILINVALIAPKGDAFD